MCKRIHHTLLHFARAVVLPPRLLTMWGLENSQPLLCTLASAHIPVVVLPSLSWCLKKRGESKPKKRKVRAKGRTSLVVLCSNHLVMLRRQFPRVGMPRVRVLPLPSMVPLRAGTTCAYLSLFVFVTELNRLPEKPMVNHARVIWAEGMLVPC
jgi:hypothetical protein